ncbi:hypothetical protein IM660_03430 [Ruania alkalisoli]|uniref:Uncharacterized protein n=1 Tax=Ruania alkalisoli TaxID=2779775 RepID=A0A7M1SWN8_9MICO|nr:hypothetical protein [Ruania alkalisoli]QOR71364.1 hypothetical protein IM660_03430 [Ruania alkalisoli]
MDVDKATVINFTVVQLVRTPTVFAFMEHIDGHLGAKFVLIEVTKTGGFDLLALSDAERDRYLALAGRAWAPRQDEHDMQASKLRTMVRKLDELSTQVTAWHWNVLASPEPVLISGDSPVVTLNPIGYHWAGLIPEGSPLWTPLSPTMLLVAEPVKPLVVQSVLKRRVGCVCDRCAGAARPIGPCSTHRDGLGRRGWPSRLRSRRCRSQRSPGASRPNRRRSLPRIGRYRQRLLRRCWRN